MIDLKTISRETGITVPNLQRIIQRVLDAFDPIIEEKFLSKQIDEIIPETDFEIHPEAFGIVDASIIRINRPKNGQRAFYSGKHRTHCVKI